MLALVWRCGCVSVVVLAAHFSDSWVYYYHYRVVFLSCLICLFLGTRTKYILCKKIVSKVYYHQPPPRHLFYNSKKINYEVGFIYLVYKAVSHTKCDGGGRGKKGRMVRFAFGCCSSLCPSFWSSFKCFTTRLLACLVRVPFHSSVLSLFFIPFKSNWVFFESERKRGKQVILFIQWESE